MRLACSASRQQFIPASALQRGALAAMLDPEITLGLHSTARSCREPGGRPFLVTCIGEGPRDLAVVVPSHNSSMRSGGAFCLCISCDLPAYPGDQLTVALWSVSGVGQGAHVHQVWCQPGCVVRVPCLVRPLHPLYDSPITSPQR